jgi:hypothetical protein
VEYAPPSQEGPFLVLGGLFGILFFLVFLGVGIYWLGFGYYLRRSEADTVADAAAGKYVDLEGTAHRHEETVRAPVSGRKCLAYNYNIEDRAGIDNRYREIDSGAAFAPFTLKTEDGTALVTAEFPELLLDGEKKQIEVPSDETPPRSVKNFLERSDHLEEAEEKGFASNVPGAYDRHQRRSTEHLLLPNETVHVGGTGRPPTEASGPLPTDTEAVVGDPTSGSGPGLVGRILRPGSFHVADLQMDGLANRKLRQGRKYLLVMALAVASILVLELLAGL